MKYLIIICVHESKSIQGGLAEIGAKLGHNDSRCFSTDARIRFSSGGIIKVSLRTPTIKAVWNMPSNERRAITQRDTAELNYKQ